jgi:hypothetical protein
LPQPRAIIQRQRSASHVCRPPPLGPSFKPLVAVNGDDFLERTRALAQVRRVLPDLKAPADAAPPSFMTCALLCLISPVASAAFPDVQTSDPARLKWMVGSPPPADRTVQFEDGSYFRFPAMRWSIANFRQLMPTINVSRGLGAPLTLPRNPAPQKKIVDYVPELAHSAFASATLRQVLDMTTALDYSQDYADPNAQVWAHAQAGNPQPKPKDYTGPRNIARLRGTGESVDDSPMTSCTTGWFRLSASQRAFGNQPPDSRVSRVKTHGHDRPDGRPPGDVLNMQGRFSNRARPLFLTVLLWLCGVALLFLVKAGIEAFKGPIAETWIDLTLVLSAYLLFFLLEPLQNWIANRSRKRARRKAVCSQPDNPA